MTGDIRPAAAVPRPAVFALMCAALLALNPLTWAVRKVSGGLFPDSIAYLAFGKALQSGTLFLDGWSHVDAGLVLPPLYPAIVAVLGKLTGDPMATSYAVSTAALLLATVPLLALACRLAGPVAGFLAVAVMQAHPLVLEFGASALTESPFVLLLALALCLLASHNERPAPWKALGLGAMAALLFWCRQVGGFFWPVAAVLVAWRALAEPRSGRVRAALAPALLVTAGFAAPMLPYAIALHAQTGHGLLTQSFRHGDYVVTRPEAFAPPATAGLDYYAQRREERQLLPDASEMVRWAPGTSRRASPSLLERAAGVPRRLLANLKHLRASLGEPGVALVILAMLSPLLARGQGPAQRARWLLPVTLLGYLDAVSLFASGIARYAHVAIPFALLQVFAEAAWLLRRLPERAPRPLAAGVAVVLAAVLVASLPKKAWSVPLSSRIGERNNPLAACAEHVRPGEGIYAFHPLGAYLLDGSYRVIPNDTLDRVVTYAAHTGVRRMVLTVLPFERAEMAYYSRSPWIENLLQLDQHDPRIRVLCRSEDGVAVLYGLGRD